MMDGRIAPSAAVGVTQEKASTAADVVNDLAHSAEIHKKKPGRQAKAKVAVEVDRPRHEDVATPSVVLPLPAAAAPTPQVVDPPAIPTEKEVQDALVAVNDKFGIDKAIECLSRFGVKRARELKEEQRAEFVKLCKSVVA